MKKAFFAGCCLVATMTLISCSSGSDDNKKTEDEVVNEMLTTEQQTILEDLGMPVNEGVNPPDITGYYLSDDQDCVADTTDYYLQDLVYYYNFHDKNGNDIKVDYFNLYGDSGEGNGAYIFGEGNKFSVYMETSGTTGSISYTTVSIFSGTLTTEGIEDFTLGFIMTSKVGDDYDEYLMPVNAARVYEEGDGLAEALATNPGFSKIMQSVKADGEAVKAAVMAGAKR